MAWHLLPMTVLCLHYIVCLGIERAPSSYAAIPAISGRLLPQKRTTELAYLNISNSTVNGTRTAIILHSVSLQFHLALKLQDVGDGSFCWMEVFNAFRPWKLAWRAPCEAVRTTSCSVRFTSRGDLQLFLPSSDTVAWRTNTSDLGARMLWILDFGNWLLLRAPTDIVWQTSEHPVPESCLIPGPIVMANASVYAPPSRPAKSGKSRGPETLLLAAVSLITYVLIFLIV